MRVISPKRLREFWTVHPDAKKPLNLWHRLAKAAEWGSFADVRFLLGTRVDRYKRFAIFDIGGNKYRLIAAIHYNTGIVYIRHVLTHAGYDSNKWKET